MPFLMSVIPTSPGTPCGVTTVISVSDITLRLDPAEPSNRTLVVPVKLVPVIVTKVPLFDDPLPGPIDVIVGAGSSYSKLTGLVAGPFGVTTTTIAERADLGGVSTSIREEFTTLKEGALTPSKVTRVASVRSVPSINTIVPPAVGPLLGDKSLMVGAVCALALDTGITAVNITKNNATSPARAPPKILTAISILNIRIGRKATTTKI